MTAPGEPGRHLLTVLHATESTGPPVFALRFLTWLSEHDPTWRISTLFLDAGGALVADFAELGDVVLAGCNAPNEPGRRPRHKMLVRRRLASLRRSLVALGPVDVSHVHCVGSMRVLPALPKAPVICHIHELDVGVDLHLGPLARECLTAADRWVAVSDVARRAFLDRFPVQPSLVERQWGFCDARRLPHGGDRKALGIPSDAFVVVASGVRHWRKAPELFVRTAVVAADLAPEIPWRFIWVGGHDRFGMENLIRTAGLGTLVTFLAHRPDPFAVMAAADALFHPAREDAFPLVCVEAAAMGIPIVTFNNGGAAELVDAAGCGVVVPFPNVHASAAAFVELARNEGLRSASGAAARRFASEHLLIQRAGPKLLEVITEAAAERP